VVGEDTKKSIFDYWKDVPDSVIEVFPRFNGLQWIILTKIKTQQLFDGREISKDDLLQGFPKHMKDKFVIAFEELIPYLNRKPHQGCGFVYSGDSHNPIFRDNSPYSKIFEQIRVNGPLKTALLNNTCELFTVDAGFIKAVGAVLDKQKGKMVNSYNIRPAIHHRKEEAGSLNAVLIISYICPNASRGQESGTQVCVFRIDGVGDIYTREDTIDICKVCKQRHKVKANGRIF